MILNESMTPLAVATAGFTQPGLTSFYSAPDIFVLAGSTLTLNAAQHAGRTIAFDQLAGSVVTLPAATGSGDIYTFVTTVVATSNSHVVTTSSATQYMSGGVITVDNADGTCKQFSTLVANGTTTRSDTITLNRTTMGSVKIGGDYFTLTDVAPAYWQVRGVLTGTGTEATPFSAAA